MKSNNNLPSSELEENTTVNTELIMPITGIPRVRAVEPDGTILATGYYFYHIHRQPGPIGDQLKPSDIDHCIVCDGFADWNLEIPIRLIKIIPPTRIEIIQENYE